MKKAYLLAPLMTAALGLGTDTHAEEFFVDQSTDNGTGSVENSLSWAVRQANLNPGPDIITLGTDVMIEGVMKTLIDGDPEGGDHDDGGGDLTVRNDGTRRTIDGNGEYRPLFVKSGNITIQNLDLTNGKAEGGDSDWGGGGAGLGGALFVYSGNVIVQGVAFKTNNASGGNGNVGGFNNGGGGMFGDCGGGGLGGGGGLFGDSTDNYGGYGGNGNYGGGNGGFGSGGSSVIGGTNGGFGGGGCGSLGGNGGFGGGGGYGGGRGDGGFGGGGGGGGFGGIDNNGGYGGGYGGIGGAGFGGGGGAGFGGAIFVANGTVTLIDTTFTENTVTAGTGYENGQASGADIFICSPYMDSTYCDAAVNICGTTPTSPDIDILGTPGDDCPISDPLDILQEIKTELNSLDPEETFSDSTKQRIFIKQIDTVISLIEQERYDEAVEKLNGGGILGKTNGCKNEGAPDKNDWIVSCEEQRTVYDLILKTIETLESI